MSAKYKFEKLKDQDNRHDTMDVSITVETDNLSDLIEAFETFLKAAGFSLAGPIVVEDDREETL